jgi:hypothetical protein
MIAQNVVSRMFSGTSCEPTSLKKISTASSTMLSLAHTGLVPGGCVAGVALGGPCFFDPPPGDWGSLPVVNDTSVPALVAYCNGNTVCGRSLDGRLVQPGATAHIGVESCDAGAVGVYREPGGPPIACVTATTQRGRFLAAHSPVERCALLVEPMIPLSVAGR